MLASTLASLPGDAAMMLGTMYFMKRREAAFVWKNEAFCFGGV